MKHAIAVILRHWTQCISSAECHYVTNLQHFKPTSAELPEKKHLVGIVTFGYLQRIISCYSSI